MLLEMIQGGGAQGEQVAPQAPVAQMDTAPFSPLSSIPEGSVDSENPEEPAEETDIQYDATGRGEDAAPDEGAS